MILDYFVVFFAGAFFATGFSSTTFFVTVFLTGFAASFFTASFFGAAGFFSSIFFTTGFAAVFTTSFLSTITDGTTLTTVFKYFLPSNLILFFLENSTIQLILACIEKSFQRYVFFHSSYLFPFCLTIIFQATTCCHPNILTHLYFGFESLRFFADHAAFL
jgi:hypothetical protein